VTNVLFDTLQMNVRVKKGAGKESGKRLFDYK